MKSRQPLQAASSVLNDARYDLPEVSVTGNGYMICSTPRCGSTLLAFVLLACGSMGVPHEYLHPTVHMPALARRFGLMTRNNSINIDDYFARIRKFRTSANGVFGVKVHYSQLAPALHIQGIAEFVDTARLVRIRRRDTVSQAISLYAASATRLWSTFDAETARAAPYPPYDGSAISQCLQTIRTQDTGWEKLFATRALGPLDIWYEDFIAAPDSVCKMVCEHVGVNPSWIFDLGHAGLQRLADAQAKDWKLRFCAERGVTSTT